MASVNAWADGMSAFKDAYGMVRGFQKTNRTKKIMDDEKFMAEGGAGYGLEGSALEKARYRALGDLETEFGNAEGGLANRRMVQQIEQGDRDNRINEANEKYRTRMEGELAEKSMLLNHLLTQATTSDRRASAGLKGGQLADLNALRDGKVKLGYATVGLRDAQTADTKSTTARRDALLPGEKAQQGATLSFTNAGTDNRKENTNLTREQITQIQKMSDAELAKLVSSTALTDENVARIKALTQPEVDNLVARTNQTDQETLRAKMMMPLDVARGVQTNLGLSLGNQEKAATLEGTVDATNAKSALQAATDTAALAAQNATRGHLETVVAADYGTAEEADAALLKLIQGDASIPRAQQMAFETAISNHGLQKLTTQSAEITKTAELKIKEGGLEAGMAYYDKIDDGVTLSLTDPDEQGNVQMIATQASDDPNSDGRERVLFQGSREQVQQQLLTQLSDPMKMMEVTAGYLDMEATKATIGLTKNQALVSAVRKDAVAASTDLANAQVDKIKQEIETAKAGLGAKDEIAYKGYASLMESESYMYMLEENPEAAANARKTYLEAFGLLEPKTSGGGGGGGGEGLAGGGRVVPEKPKNLADNVDWEKTGPLWNGFTDDQKLLFLEPGQTVPVDPKADKTGGLASNVAPPSQTGEPWNADKAPEGFPQAEWDASDATKRKRILKTLKSRAAQAGN